MSLFHGHKLTVCLSLWTPLPIFVIWSPDYVHVSGIPLQFFCNWDTLSSPCYRVTLLCPCFMDSGHPRSLSVIVDTLFAPCCMVTRLATMFNCSCFVENIPVCLFVNTLPPSWFRRYPSRLSDFVETLAMSLFRGLPNKYFILAIWIQWIVIKELTSPLVSLNNKYTAYTVLAKA